MQIDASAEASHWRALFASRPYALPEFDFEDYGPAYRLGVDHFCAGGRFEDDDALALAWQASKCKSRLWWSDARPAAHEAFERLRAMHGGPPAP